MKWTYGLLLLISLPSFAFQPNTTSPQNPGVLYYPGLQKGHELNPFNRPPQNNVITGSDQATTRFDQSGYMDTTPVDDTGTEKDIYHKLQPNWVVPSENVPLSQPLSTPPR
ncbi:hypothetical protein [Legionella hackeliae]|uniref:Uncharacterized protein n=1 Tax=Legionella hackeliae TaxID=449 RepID=A0A0A8UUX6_LEGHA|nr:hypothetical protein [Legionella hackeliae]KTD09775.1 hypothetical protein Lhac_2143 [Legionella hackeliae]CEK10897.1 exported protein of unknown function [Legionella hackeliae]STX47635.1 Uncharacterised protein [Legionella hackeliae]